MIPCPRPDHDCGMKWDGQCIYKAVPDKCLAACPPQTPPAPDVTAKSSAELSSTLSETVQAALAAGWKFPLARPSNQELDNPLYNILNAAVAFVQNQKEIPSTTAR